MEAFGAEGYVLARELLQRGVALVYLIALVAVVHQWAPLAGQRGLTPAPAFLARVPWRRAPSLFQFGYSDRLAIGLAWVGIVVALSAVLGIPQSLGTGATLLAFGLLWALYLSYVNVGQVWYGYGWESLLLEAGFLVAFLGGREAVVPWPALLLVRWLLFRVELGAGLIKLRGDPCWRDLSCLDYHHETQPLPNVLSRRFHSLPARLHRAEVLANHVTQLLAPFLLFLPQPAAGVAGILMIVTQGWLALSGNFAWLNLLTMVLATSTLPDAWLRPALGWLAPAPPAQQPLWFGVIVLVAFASQLALAWWPARNLVSRRQRMNASFNPLHLAGSYGAFGSVTRTRMEIVIEGTMDPSPGPGSDWRAYELPAKPGSPRRRPRQVAPYHLRLDWQLWFAAMSPRPTRSHAWFAVLLHRILEGDPGTRRLLGRDPFDGGTPSALRARRYRYRFASGEQRRQGGAWWSREPWGSGRAS